MRKTLLVSFVVAVVAVVAFSAVAADPAPKPRTVTEVVTLTAKITAIDTANRAVTLMGPKGNVVTLAVSDDVKRFSELKVGDEVTVKYTEQLVARIAKPGEVASVDASVKRSEGAKPGAMAKESATVVVTLTVVDTKTPSVSFKTEAGDVKTVKVRDVKNLEGYKVGDKVALTYSESLAIDVSTPVQK